MAREYKTKLEFNNCPGDEATEKMFSTIATSMYNERGPYTGSFQMEFELKGGRASLKKKKMSGLSDDHSKMLTELESVGLKAVSKGKDGAKVKAYLFTTAYHTMIDRLRKEKRETYSSDRKGPEASHEINYSDLGEILKEAVSRLPEVQRMVLLLRDYEGYSYQEVGEIAGLTESQVKVYIYRARLFLKNYIGKPEIVL